MICYFNAGKERPVVVESTMVAAVLLHDQGATQLLTTGGSVLVDVNVPAALEILGWPPIPPPSNVTAPFVGGEGLVRTTLTSTMGTWTGDPWTYDYQWMSDEVQVGTNANAYTIAPTDEGHSITCIVTATNGGGSTVGPPSNAVVVVNTTAMTAAALAEAQAAADEAAAKQAAANPTPASA